MAETEQTVTDIAILKNEVSGLTRSYGKLEAVIEKMGEVSNNIARMLAVHEQRLTTHENTDKELFALVEKRKEELQVDVKELHSRITTVQRELSSEITHTEEKIKTALEQGLAEIKKCITGEHALIADERKKMNDRLTALENWKWFIAGVGAVIGFFAERLLTFFK